MKLNELILQNTEDKNLNKVLKLVIHQLKKIYTGNITIGSKSELSKTELIDFAKLVNRYDHKAPVGYGPITAAMDDISGIRIEILQNGEQLTDIVQIVIQDMFDYWYFYNTDSPDKNVAMYDLLYTMFTGAKDQSYIKNVDI